MTDSRQKHNLLTMENTNIENQYKTLLILFVYSVVLVPLLAIFFWLNLPSTASLCFWVPVLVLYLAIAVWIAFKMKFHAIFKIIWVLANLVYLAYLLGDCLYQQ